MAHVQFLPAPSCIGVVLILLLCSSASTLPCSRAASCTCGDEKKKSDTITYSFPSFSSRRDELISRLAFLGNATVSQGALQVTPDSANSFSEYLVNQSGSTLLLSPVKLWHIDSHGVKHDASFNTSFTMILYRPDKEVKGEGLAFVIAPTLNGPPPGSSGGFLGLTNSTTRTASGSSSSFVAVEFDTVKQSYDPDDNHIGLNIGSIQSDYYTSLSLLPPSRKITLAPRSSATYTVWIDYYGVGHHIWVYINVSGEPKPTQAHLDAPLNLSSHVPQQAYIGFSASTGVGFELNAVLSWNLTVDKLPDDSRSKQWKTVTLPAVLGSAAVTAVMISVAAFYFNSKYKDLKMELELSEALRRLPGTPREFKHGVIRKATNNFHHTRKLGQGGFGAVYRGTLRSGKEKKDDGRTRVEVAVKRFTRDDKRCYDDFLAEVDIINRLRHRNLVPLIGWCYQKGELLLIYEYMPNGSLDQHLFRNGNGNGNDNEQPIIGWSRRYNIVMDVAAGLHYVHHEHEHMVLHRDIKASNVMLDSSFRGRLGDFGLARIVGFNKESYTDLGVAGTWGFIAPEYSVCHKATRKTDVYAFGVLVLEIVTGRRALGGGQGHGTTFLLLTDWVWKLHQEGRLVEAVNGEVAADGEFDPDDAVRLLLLGLACCNPNPSDRPSVAEVVQIVAKSVKPPDVPLAKPTFVWPPVGGIQLELDDDMAVMSDDFDSEFEADWEDTTSSHGHGLAVSAPSEINRNKQACVVKSRKCRSADECYV